MELINFYELLLGQKQGAIVEQIERLEKGLYTMDNTTKQVDLLKEKLVLTMQEVEVEKKKTDELIEIVTAEAAIADREQEIASKQEAETNIVADAAKAAMAKANKELEAAVPAMEAAREAVDCLEVKAINEYRGYTAPPGGTEDVASATQILLFGVKNERQRTWPSQQKMMNPPPQFIQQLIDYNKEEILEW